MSSAHHYRRRAPCRPVRPRARRPWIPAPLAFLVLVAGGLWLAAEFERREGVDDGMFLLCTGPRQVQCVVDGDTIRYGGERIRLADIDAPEVSEPKCATERELGVRATHRLVDLLNEGPFRLVRTGRDRDIYGRQLRTIERDGRSLGAILVSEGLARPWDGARRGWCA